MKKPIAAIAIVIFAASLQAVVTFDGEGKIATIPAGETYTVDDTKISEVEALTNIVFGSTTSALAFTNTLTINLNAALSGAKGKVTTVSGVKLNLVGNSPAFQGAFTFADSTVTVSNRYALGVSGATVSSTNTSGLSNLYRLTFGGAGLTNDAAITCSGHHRFQRDNTNETLVFNKEFAAGPDSVQIHFGTCKLPNGYKSTGGSPQPQVIGGCDAYLGKLTFGGNITFFDHADGSARLHLTSNNNAVGLAFTVPSKLTVVCEATNCLYSTVSIGQLFLNSNRALPDGRSFDLNGYDQTIRTITKNSYSEAIDRPEQIYSATPAMLTLNGASTTARVPTTDFTLPMQFHGKASFKLNIPADATLHLSYGKSDSTETLEVASGTLDFTQNAGWGGTNVVVSGGTLNVNSQYSISNENARLVVSAGTLVLNSNVKVKSANIGGVELEQGAYTVDEMPTAAQAYVSGAAKLYVDYEEGQVIYKTSYWKGGADASLTNAANWADGKAPNFTDGGATLVFSNEVAATVNGSLSVYGLQMLGNRGVVISGTASDKLKLGHGGILSTNAFEAADGVITNRIAVALQTTSSEADTWEVATGTVLDLDCDISAGGSTTLSLYGVGRYLLRGDNTGITRPVTLNTGYYEFFTPTALGSTIRATTFTARARFWFNCLTNDVPIAGSPANQIPESADPECFPWRADGAPLVQNGAISEGVGNALNMAGLTIRGGLTGGNMTISAEPTEGFVEVGSFKSVNGALGFMLREGTVNLASTNNDWTMFGLYNNLSLLKCRAANVMAATRVVVFGDTPTRPYGTFDLNGYNQVVSGVDHGCYNKTRVYDHSETYYGTITSAVPATLTAVGTPAMYFDAIEPKNFNPTNSVKYRGQVSLTVNNDASVVTTLINMKSDTTGSLKVLQSRLVLAWGAGWMATTNVVISGGVLQVEDESASCAFGGVGSTACMHITGSGKLQLDGGQAVVYALSLGDSYLAPGIYGGSAAGLDQAHTLSCITGSGTLRVKTNGNPNGLMILFR